MLGTLATLYSYRTAPRTTFYLKHPVKAIAARRAWSSLTGDMARRIAIGVGAAAVALPLGLWLGRRANHGG
ncbi:MAG: hypothetical protein ACOC8B_05570 [Gemmatimonadota bacterium]